MWPFRRRAPAPEAPPAAVARLDRVPDPDIDAPDARVPRLRTDGFVDTLAGHGTDRDPRLGMYFLPDLLTEEQEIQIVRGSWLGKRIVGDIVDEAFRPGWELEIGEHAQAIQREVGVLTRDVELLGERVEKLGRHFRQVTEDIADTQTSVGRIVAKGQRIKSVDLGGESSREISEG